MVVTLTAGRRKLSLRNPIEEIIRIPKEKLLPSIIVHLVPLAIQLVRIQLGYKRKTRDLVPRFGTSTLQFIQNLSAKKNAI